MVCHLYVNKTFSCLLPIPIILVLPFARTFLNSSQNFFILELFPVRMQIINMGLRQKLSQKVYSSKSKYSKLISGILSGRRKLCLQELSSFDKSNDSCSPYPRIHVCLQKKYGKQYGGIEKIHSWAYFWRKTWFKITHAPNVHSSTVYNSQDLEAT